MRTLWYWFLDRFFPRYIVGFDPAYKSDYSTIVVMQKKRDGTLWVVNHSEGSFWSELRGEGDA